MIADVVDLTVEQLKFRVQFHTSTANMLEAHGETCCARKFHELASLYREELERRGEQPRREPQAAPEARSDVNGGPEPRRSTQDDIDALKRKRADLS